MTETGTGMEEIRSHPGHENVATMRRIYARLSQDYVRGAAASLERPRTARGDEHDRRVNNSTHDQRRLNALLTILNSLVGSVSWWQGVKGP
jgi:hypothetical protein